MSVPALPSSLSSATRPRRGSGGAGRASRLTLVPGTVRITGLDGFQPSPRPAAGDLPALVEAATSEMLLQPDWDINMRIVDGLNAVRDPEACVRPILPRTRLPGRRPRSASALRSMLMVVAALRKRLSKKDHRVIMHTLVLVETLVKNCSARFHNAMVSDKLTKALARVVEVRPAALARCAATPGSQRQRRHRAEELQVQLARQAGAGGQGVPDDPGLGRGVPALPARAPRQGVRGAVPQPRRQGRQVPQAVRREPPPRLHALAAPRGGGCGGRRLRLLG